MSFIPPCIPVSHLYRTTSTKCRTNTVVSPDDGHIIPSKHVEKRNKHNKKNCTPSWLYLQENTTYLVLHAKFLIFLSNFKHNLDFLDSFFFTKCLIIRFDGNLSSCSRARLWLGGISDGHEECSRRFQRLCELA